MTHQPGRRHKERRSFVKGFSRYIYSHHFTCFCHSTELALFILDGPCAPLECNKLEERRPNRNKWFNRSILLQRGNLAMTKTLQRLLEAWPCAYGGASGADANIGTWSQPTRPVVFVSRQFSCQLPCTFSGKYVRECLGKIGDLSVELTSRSLCKGKGSPWKYFNGVACCL